MFRFDLGTLLQGQMGKPYFKVLITCLLLILEVCNVKPTHRKSWVGNLLMWSNLTLDPSFKVKGGQPNLKMLITSGIFSLYIFYFCFYRFAMFGDTPPARNKAIGISLVNFVLLNINCTAPFWCPFLLSLLL